MGRTGAADADGAPVELDMIAGALVNEKDISCGLFTPDVTCAPREPLGPERLFWSRLPQALSTEAEMTARYGRPPLDGRTGCLQRVHVTGGTNGILIDALCRRQVLSRRPSSAGPRTRPISCPRSGEERGRAWPTSIARGSSCVTTEIFAGEAVRAARAGKAVGDIVRVLQFSAYARALGGTEALKRRLDPFTGCFISRIPRAVALLRFALEAAAELKTGPPGVGAEFVRTGAVRMRDELAFTDDPAGGLERRLAGEREGWAAFYEALSAAGSNAGGAAQSAAAVIRSFALAVVKGR